MSTTQHSSSALPLCPTPTESISHARAWIAAFTNWDLDRIYNLTTSRGDLKYLYLPASTGMAPKSLKEWRKYNLHMRDFLPDFNVQVLDVYECNGCVIAHIVGRATSRNGTPFFQEYVMFIHVRCEYDPTTRDRTIKVHRVEEFIDTRFANSFFEAEKSKEKRDRGQSRHVTGPRRVSDFTPSMPATTVSGGERNVHHTSKL